MNEKLKKISKNLEPLLNENDSVNDIYTNLITIAKNQSDYFKHLGVSNFIKIVIYIYSLRKTGSFSLGDKMIDNLEFAELLTTDNEETVEMCQECDGSGEVPCKNCDSSGQIECDNCNGQGGEDCNQCDGDGLDNEGDDCANCDGTGMISCEQCDGDGVENCPECGAHKYYTCPECDGQAEINKPGFVVIDLLLIATWDPIIKNKCEIEERTTNPIMSVEKFEDNNNYILLNRTYHDAEINVESSQLYCLDYDDEMDISFRNDMYIESKKFPNLAHLY